MFLRPVLGWNFPMWLSLCHWRTLVSALSGVNPNFLHELRQNFARFAEERIIGEGSQRCRILVDLDHDCAAFFGATPQIRRRINNARGPDGKEDVACFGG